MRARLFAAAVLSAACLNAAAADSPLFRFAGQDYAEDDLPASAQRSLYEAKLEYYNKQREIVDTAILRMHLEAEAEKTGKTLEEVAEERLAVTPPAEKQVQDFYEANRQRIPAPYAQVRGEIARYLENQRRDAKKAGLVAGLKAGSEFESFLREPQAPRYDIATEGYPAKGNPEAKVTVVEFADYQCPHCKHAAEALKSLMEVYGDRVRLVYMDFPINRSGVSRKVAEGAMCADRQDKFWAYHDEAFARQAGLSMASPAAIAKAVGLDEDAFRACLASPEPAEKVGRALAEARRLGLDSTPSLFVNGKPVQAQEIEQSLREAIERALEDSGA